MNNIRGFSYSVPAREASLSHETRNAEAPPQLESGANSFENVLTGLSQDSGDAEVMAKPSQQSPPWSLLANEQFAKENGAGSDAPASEGTLDAAEAAAKQGLTTGLSKVKPIAPPAHFWRADLAAPSTSPSISASGLSRLAVSSAAASAAASPSLSRSRDLQETVKWEDATNGVAAKGVLDESLSGHGMHVGPDENAAIDAPIVTEPNLAGPDGGPVSALPRSGARPGNSETRALATDSQTGATGRAGASRRDLFASFGAVPAGKSQRSRGTPDASQTPATNGAGADAALSVIPVAMFDSHSFSASHSSDAASVQTTAPGNPGAPVFEKGADRSVRTPDEDVPPTQISTQSGVAGQGGFGNSFAMKVNVVSSATHFAPVARLSPVQQIAGFVANALPALAGGSAGAGEASAVAASGSFDLPLAAAQPSAEAVRTLNLQLEPESLGQVSIRLNLSGEGLDLQVNADRGATVDLLEKDKQSLSDQIRQSGYSVAGLEIRLAGPAASNLSSNGGGSNQAMPGNGQATGGSTRGDGGSAHDSSARAQNQQNSFGTSPQDTSGGSPDRRSARGDLYV